MQLPYIGRLAPSPTGLLHLGHAATFWHASPAPAHTTAHSSSATKTSTPTAPARLHRRHARRPQLARHPLAPPIITQSQRLPLYRELSINSSHRPHLPLPLQPQRPRRHDRTHPTKIPTTNPSTPAPAAHKSNPITTLPTQHQLPLPRPRQRNHPLRRPQPRPAILHRRPDFGDFLIWRKTASPATSSPA